MLTISTLFNFMQFCKEFHQKGTMSVKGKARYFLIGFLCLAVLSAVSGQDQKLADSLYRIYKENRLTDTARMELLRNLSFNKANKLLITQAGWRP